MNLTPINPNVYVGLSDHYVYNGVKVPRVTEILSAMLHEEYLMKWANWIGRGKHENHEFYTERAADIGTKVHKAIELYLSSDKGFDSSDYDMSIRDFIVHAFLSFMEWWEIIQKNDYEILLQEHKMACKYFGGTLDMLIKINGKTYLVDFKTSNYPSYKHFLQLSAYKYMLELEGYKVDGCIVLYLNKKNFTFKEKVLDFNREDDLNFINQCQECFLSLVYGFYMRNIIENMYKKKFGGR